MTEAQLLLAGKIRACTLCPLHKTRTLAVPAWVGPRYRGLAIICEAPGRDEDISGRPLVGRAGQLLDTYLEAVGLSRDELMLTNRVRCRPPYNDIRSAEAVSALATCDKWTQEELNVYGPRVVVLMGSTAAKPQFGSLSVSTGRGTYTTSMGTTYVYTYHPAAALRNPELGKYIMEDLLLAKELFNEAQ
jgi:DNA polymerase